MKPTTVLTSSGAKCARDGVGAGLEGLLVEAVMGVGGERAALAGFEIHDVVADRAALQRERRLARLGEKGEIDAEAAVGRFGSGDRLEDEIDGRALRDQARAWCVTWASTQDWVGMSSRWRRSSSSASRSRAALRAVGGGVDADHGVAAAEEQAVEDAGGDAARVVGRVVGLQADGEPARQADGVAEAGDDAASLRGDGMQVLVAHDLADGGGHFRREAGGERGEGFGGGLVGEQPVAESADGEVGDGREGVRSCVSMMRRVTSSVS